jgi:hypothetical protein
MTIFKDDPTPNAFQLANDIVKGIFGLFDEPIADSAQALLCLLSYIIMGMADGEQESVDGLIASAIAALKEQCDCEEFARMVAETAPWIGRPEKTCWRRSTRAWSCCWIRVKLKH